MAHERESAPRPRTQRRGAPAGRWSMLARWALAHRRLYAAAVAALAVVAMELHALVTGTFQLWAVLLIAAIAVVTGRRLDPRRRRLRAAKRAAESPT